MNLNETVMENVFTEVEGGINGTLNKLTVKCFDSVNNKFSMDCDGNLVVNSITTRVNTEQEPVNSLTFDQIYPVGSIYLNVTDVNPATLFGGTWERIQDKFLLASGSSFANGTEGGAIDHNHTISHSHSINGHSHYIGSHSHGIGNLYAKIQNTAGRFRIGRKSTPNYYTSTYVATNVGYFEDKYDNAFGVEIGGDLDGSGTQYTNDTGVMYANDCGAINSGSTSNLPPYLAVYIWKRTA